MENWRSYRVAFHTSTPEINDIFIVSIMGPMENLVTDQEGGLIGQEANAFFDNFEVTRLVTGTDGSTSKGLVERHISSQS